MANLYNKDGWIDFDKLNRLSSTLNIVIGPRNAGKTYGKLLYNHQHNIPYVFLRTTQKQIDTVFLDNLSPFEKINHDTGSRYCCARLPKSSIIGVYEDYTETDGKRKPTGKPVNYCAALMQIGSVRGFNLDTIPELIYDEFVKHPGEIIQNYNKSALMYFDIMSTLNRAREINGRPAIKQWLFGNSDNLGVPLLQELRLIRPIMSMLQAGENFRKIKEREISIFICNDSPAARRLKEISTIAKIIDGTDYAEMAYHNAFVYDDFSMCEPQPIGQYNPIAVIGKIMLMEHKTKDLYYVRRYEGNVSGVRQYSDSVTGRELFRVEFGYLYYWLLNDSIYFSAYSEKLYFKALLKVDNN